MNLSCETIINENEKLKLSDLEKSCLNIFDYLRLHHNINFLTINIKKMIQLIIYSIVRTLI